MAISVIVLLLLGVIIFFIWRGGTLKLSHAVLCVLLGLLLSQMGNVGPWLLDGTTSLAGLPAKIEF
ncbi:hypothetical protein GCM10009601_43020 [Streptomyces thermospinosisporus]|uniref:Uncharacterized protein n=1 Tax=Streptomyces thermospinosisporus TaxID=161482 RepID=A0ABN1Z2L3_9ACTN